MSTLLLILSVILGGWWLILTVIVVANYIERVRDAKIPPTPEELEDCRQLEEHTRILLPTRNRRWENFIALPFFVMFLLLLWPWFLYALVLKYRDPYDKHLGH